MDGGSVWALILAAGEGSRLSSLTTTASGLSVPKQFCSLRGGGSLLEEALTRAEAVTTRRRTLSVVADQHRRWWESPLWALAPDNIIVQPQNRGTAAGLLLPILHILQRDPDATVVVLPSDHFVHDEATLARTLRQASRLAATDPAQLYLLGLEPDEVDPELGYIVPSTQSALAAACVERFVEKPAMDIARGLIAEGALLNMFIIAASARAFVGLYEKRHADVLARMRQAVEHDSRRPQAATAARQLYPHLSSLDFSRDVLEGQEARLRVLPVPACGWSDLGTPRRVADTLARVATQPLRATGAPGRAFLNLAEQHSRQQAGYRLHDCA